MPFVWISHSELPSVPLPSFPELPHKPASVHENGPSRGVRLEGFSRTAVTVLISVPFMIAMTLPERLLVSLAYQDYIKLTL